MLDTDTSAQADIEQRLSTEPEDSENWAKCHLPSPMDGWCCFIILTTFNPILFRFTLLESRDLGPGQVRQVDALGLNLAVYRGTSGKVFVTDAYCPHLGANIAAGGR